MLKKLVGDKKFYKMVMAVALPIMIQNGITNFVSLLDNIMVGQTGTESMTGVAIANQLLFVFYLCIFGGFSGAGIFTAQYYGKGDNDGIRYSIRFKMYIGIILTTATALIFSFYGRDLVRLFLYQSDSTGDLELTLDFAMKYLRIMMLGILPFTITQLYSSTLRETGNPMVPMYCGILAICVNLCFNYILIYGKLGFPKLGAEGAAIATVVSRFAECISISIWTHKHPENNPFMRGLYKSLRIPLNVAKRISVKGLPLLINEGLWSAGTTMLSQCYATRGLDVVCANNISSTISNLFSITFMALGTAISIIIGNLLGASKMEEAKDTSTKMLAFTVASSTLVGIVMASVSTLIPKIYNTTDEIRSLATFFLLVMAAYLPVHAYINGLYFTLRSGGKTWITFLFDSVYVWTVNFSIAFILTRFTDLSIYPIFIAVYAIDIIKCIIGTVLLKSGSWLHNIVEDKK